MKLLSNDTKFSSFSASAFMYDSATSFRTYLGNGQKWIMVASRKIEGNFLSKYL